MIEHLTPHPLTVRDQSISFSCEGNEKVPGKSAKKMLRGGPCVAEPHSLLLEEAIVLILMPGLPYGLLDGLVEIQYVFIVVGLIDEVHFFFVEQ